MLVVLAFLLATFLPSTSLSPSLHKQSSVFGNYISHSGQALYAENNDVQLPNDTAATLKSRIFAACAASDRGYAASPSDRRNIEDQLLNLSTLSPLVEPTLGVDEGLSNSPLKACWRLVYTSASDVSTLGASGSSSVGGIYQDARELPVITNVIDLSPRILQNLPPGRASEALSTVTRIKVQTRARARSPTCVGLTFESDAVSPISTLGLASPSWLPSLKVPLPQLGLDLQRLLFGVSESEDPRDAPNNPGFFDVLYLDDDFLVIKQGGSGGIFAAIKVDGLSS